MARAPMPAWARASPPAASARRAVREGGASVAQSRTTAGRPLQGGEGALLAAQVLKREVGGGEGLEEPAGARRRRRRRGGDVGRQRRQRAVGLRPGLASLLDPEPVVQRDVGERLGPAARPLDGEPDDPLAGAQAEEQLLRVLGEEAGARVHLLRPAKPVRLDGHLRADRVPVARHPGPREGGGGADEAHGEGRPALLEVVSEEAQLGRGAGGQQHEVRVAVPVEVQDGEGPPVLVEVEPDRTRDVVESSLAVVAQEHVPVVAGDRVLDHEPVQGPPGVVVGSAGGLGQRRPRHDAAPEHPVQVLLAGLAGHHAVHGVEVLPPVAVEVQGAGRPGPAAHVHPGRQGHVLEGAVAPVPEERVAPRVVAVERADVRRGVGHEVGARRHPETAVAPHLAAVDVEAAVAVVVEEEDAHPGRVVLDARLRRHVLEPHLPVAEPEVVVQVLPPEVVRHHEVRPPVAVVVPPGGGEAEAVVPRVEAHLAGDLDEAAVAVVPEEHVGGAVHRVVIGRGCPRLRLARAVVVGVDAQVEIEEAVAVVVGDRHRHGRALELLLEAEGAGLAGEPALSVVEEEDRSRADDDDQVLVAVVVHVGEERVLRVLQEAEARLLRRVLEGAVAPGPVETVGKPVRLGDVDVVETVAVGVPDRDAVVAVRVAGEPRVHRGHPGVEPDAELAAEGVVSSQGGRGDLGEDRGRGAAAEMLGRRPLDHAPAGSGAPPPQAPVPQPLDAHGVLARPHEVVAHVGRRERLVPVQVEGGDQELGDRDLPEVLEQQAQLPPERTGVQDQVRGHRAGPEDLERGRPGHGRLSSTGRSRPPRNEGARRKSATRAAPSGLSFNRPPSSRRRAMSSSATRSSGKRSLPGVISSRNGCSVSETTSSGR